MSKINLNQPPFYDNGVDEFNKKNYKQVLFNPQVAVQNRELTAIGTYAKESMKSLGDSIYTNGKIISGCDVKSIDKANSTITMNTGKIYADGYIHDIDPDLNPSVELILPINVTGEDFVYIEIVEELVGATGLSGDESLKDPAIGTDNFGYEGASRLKVWARYLTKSSALYDTSKNYITVVELLDGEVKKGGLKPSDVDDKPTLETSEDITSKKMFNVLGDYVISGFKSRHSETDDVLNRLCVEVDQGSAFINGNFIEYDQKTYFYPQVLRFDYAVYDEIHVIDKKGEINNYEYSLDQSPLTNIIKISVPVIETKNNMNPDSGTVGNSHNLPSGYTMKSVEKVYQGGTIFVENSDYTVGITNTGFAISWLGSGNKPVGNYSVDYVYNRILDNNEYEIDYFGNNFIKGVFDVKGGSVTFPNNHYNIFIKKIKLLDGTVLEKGTDYYQIHNKVYFNCVDRDIVLREYTKRNAENSDLLTFPTNFSISKISKNELLRKRDFVNKADNATNYDYEIKNNNEIFWNLPTEENDLFKYTVAFNTNSDRFFDKVEIEYIYETLEEALNPETTYKSKIKIKRKIFGTQAQSSVINTSYKFGKTRYDNILLTKEGKISYVYGTMENIDNNCLVPIKQKDTLVLNEVMFKPLTTATIHKFLVRYGLKMNDILDVRDRVKTLEYNLAMTDLEKIGDKKFSKSSLKGIVTDNFDTIKRHDVSKSMEIAKNQLNVAIPNVIKEKLYPNFTKRNIDLKVKEDATTAGLIDNNYYLNNKVTPKKWVDQFYGSKWRSTSEGASLETFNEPKLKISPDSDFFSSSEYVQTEENKYIYSVLSVKNNYALKSSKFNIPENFTVQFWIKHLDNNPSKYVSFLDDTDNEILYFGLESIEIKDEGIGLGNPSVEPPTGSAPTEKFAVKAVDVGANGKVFDWNEEEITTSGVELVQGSNGCIVIKANDGFVIDEYTIKSKPRDPNSYTKPALNLYQRGEPDEVIFIYNIENINEDYEISAKFKSKSGELPIPESQTRKVMVFNHGNGTVKYQGNIIDGSNSTIDVVHGGSVSLEVIANTGYALSSISDNGTVTEHDVERKILKITNIIDDHTVLVMFKKKAPEPPQTANLTVNITGLGKLKYKKLTTIETNPLVDINGGVHNLAKNFGYTFKANAETGWKIKSIEFYSNQVSGAPDKSEYDFTIESLHSDCILNVVFEQLVQPKPMRQIYAHGLNVKIEVWNGSFLVPRVLEPFGGTRPVHRILDGENITVKIIPESGYIIKEINVNGVNQSISNPKQTCFVKFNNINEDKRILVKAEKEVKPYPYTIRVVSLGSYITQNFNVQNIKVYVRGEVFNFREVQNSTKHISEITPLHGWCRLGSNSSEQYYYSTKRPLEIMVECDSGYVIKRMETGSYPDSHQHYPESRGLRTFQTSIPISKLLTRQYGNGCVVFVEPTQSGNITPPPAPPSSTGIRTFRIISDCGTVYGKLAGSTPTWKSDGAIFTIPKNNNPMVLSLNIPRGRTLISCNINGTVYRNCLGRKYQNSPDFHLFTDSGYQETYMYRVSVNMLRDNYTIYLTTGPKPEPILGGQIHRNFYFMSQSAENNIFNDGLVSSSNINSGFSDFDFDDNFLNSLQMAAIAEDIPKVNTKFGNILSILGTDKHFLNEPKINQWSNYTFTFDGTKKEIAMYIDGKHQYTLSKVPENIWNKIKSAKSVTVGSKRANEVKSGNFYFTELKIYDKVLNETEIKNGCDNKAKQNDPNIFKLYSLSTDHNGMDMYIGDSSEYVADHTFFSFGIKEKRPYHLVLNNAIDHSLGAKPAPIIDKNSTNIGSYTSVDQKTDVSSTSKNVGPHSTLVTTTTKTTSNTYNNTIIQDKITTTNFEEKVIGESAKQLDFITGIEASLTLRERNILIYGYDFFPDQNNLVCFFNNVRVPFIKTTSSLPDISADIANNTTINTDGTIKATNSGEFIAEIKIPPNQPIGVREIRVEFPGASGSNGVKINYFGAGIKSNKIASTIKTPIKAWVSQKSEIVQKRIETELVKTDVNETVNVTCQHCPHCDRCNHCNRCADCSRCNHCSNCGRTSPLAQSLYVNDYNRFMMILKDVKEKSDVFVVASDIYFKSIVNDTNILNGFVKLTDSGVPITLTDDSIDRSVSNLINIPTSKVNITNGNPHLGSAATKVSYITNTHFKSNINANHYINGEPIRLDGGKGYGYIVGSGNGNNTVWVAEIGKQDVLSQKLISEEPDRGVLMSAPNMNNWATYIMEDLKYALYIADFWTDNATLKDVVENSRKAKVSYIEFDPIEAGSNGLELINFFEFVAHSDLGTDGNSLVRYEYKDKVDGEWAKEWKPMTSSYIVNLEYGAEALMFRVGLISFTPYSSPIVSKDIGVMIGQYELNSYYTSYNTKMNAYNTLDIYYGGDNIEKFNGVSALEYSTNGGISWNSIVNENTRYMGFDVVDEETNLKLLHFNSKLYLNKPILLDVEQIPGSGGVFKHSAGKKYYFAITTLDDELRETELSDPVEVISTENFDAKLNVKFDASSFGYRVYACQVADGETKNFVRVYDSTLFGRLANIIGLGNDQIRLKDDDFDVFKKIFPEDKDMVIRVGEENILATMKTDHILCKTRGYLHTPKTSHNPDEIVYFGNDGNAMNLSPVVNINFPYRFPLENNKYSETFITKLDINNIKADILTANTMVPEYNEYNKPRYIGNNLQYRIVLMNKNGEPHIRKISEVPTFSKLMLIATKDVL